MATNGNFVQQDQYKVADPSTAAPAIADSATDPGDASLSKDEVGWYFVEQYYTTLSKSPEKLHLFYGKTSQFVYGKEAEVANVSVGRQAIQERIKALDFQDCKVRVSNVDSQASSENIVIQVIGETSNKSGEPKKFVQTFVLAQQPSGYFVLNDVFRYIDEGDEDSAAENAETDAPAQVEAVVVEPAKPAKAEAATADEPELNADVVDKKLSEAPKDPARDGTLQAAVDTQQDSQIEAPVETASTQESVDEDSKQDERPPEPAPTPATKTTAAPVAEATSTEQAPSAAPARPMTWASRVAAAGPKPALPLPKTATPPAQGRAPPAATAAATAAATTAVANANAAPATTPSPASTADVAPSSEAAKANNAGWQTAGADSKRQNRPQSISASTEKEGTMGYVKYVTEKVQDADLKAALASHGELTYFDINRQKNCAFVEFKTIEGYQAAVAANPHVVNGENIVVEPRRPKSNAYGGSNYSGRGGAAGRGRGGFENRTGGQSARGNFNGQNKGRGGATRPRGGAQQTPA